MAEFDDDWLFPWLEKFLNENAKELDEECLAEIVGKSIQESLPRIARNIADSLKDSAHFMLTEHRELRNEFNGRLRRRWFEAFDLLEMIIVALSELGEEVANSLREDDQLEKSQLVEVLSRLNVRSIRISREILCLLRNGFADGALTRWRSVHEIAVLAMFLSKHGEQVATLFLEYADVERYREAVLYQEHAERLGYDPVSLHEMKDIRARKEFLTQKYTKDFAKSYGWTLRVLAKGKRNFKGIEESIDLDHLRPFYAMASRSLHATPKGLYGDLGLMDDASDGTFLAGASNYGMADPGQNTAISLLQMTSVLVMQLPSVSRLAGLEAARLLLTEMSYKFVEIQRQMEEEEKNRENHPGIQ